MLLVLFSEEQPVLLAQSCKWPGCTHERRYDGTYRVSDLRTLLFGESCQRARYLLASFLFLPSYRHRYTPNQAHGEHTQNFISTKTPFSNSNSVDDSCVSSFLSLGLATGVHLSLVIRIGWEVSSLLAVSSNGKSLDHMDVICIVYCA